MKDLDHRLAALGRTEIDRDLGELEGEVWTRIDARSALSPIPQRWAALLCCSLAAIASMTGASVAAATEKAPPQVTAFNIHSPLAPSTLLAD